MPDWLQAVVSADEFMGLVYRVHDPVIMTNRIAVLIDPDLLPPAEQQDPFNTVLRLIEIQGNLRGVFGWTDDVELSIDPWSQRAEEFYRAQGYRIVRLVRDENDPLQDPLPNELMLLALSQAVSSGEEVFAINVTHYLKLRGLDYHEIRDRLTGLYA